VRWTEGCLVIIPYVHETILCASTNERLGVASSIRQKPTVWLQNSLIRFELTHCGRVTQIRVFNTVKLGTSASSP
jgi:hypothetical protein